RNGYSSVLPSKAKLVQPIGDFIIAFPLIMFGINNRYTRPLSYKPGNHPGPRKVAMDHINLVLLYITADGIYPLKHLQVIISLETNCLCPQSFYSGHHLVLPREEVRKMEVKLLPIVHLQGFRQQHFCAASA